MKIYVLILIFSMIIFERVFVKERVLYKKGQSESRFPKRVVYFIEEKAQQMCHLDAEALLNLEERVESHPDFFEYSLVFTRGPKKEMGKLLVNEYHNGKLELNYLKCPTGISRSIGSLTH